MTQSTETKVTEQSKPSTKDSGRVHVGGGMMHFGPAPASTKDAGKVHVGGGMMRF